MLDDGAVVVNDSENADGYYVEEGEDGFDDDENFIVPSDYNDGFDIENEESLIDADFDASDDF